MAVISKKKIRHSIANVKASLAVEGLTVSRNSVIYGAKYLRGEMSSQEIIDRITKDILNKKQAH